MSDSKMREEFEAYAATQGMSVVMENAAMYQDRRTCDHWRTWQASRADLVIELPSPYAVIGDYAACGGGRAVWDNAYAEKIEDRMCEKTPVYDKASLESAGVRVQS